MPRFIPLNYQQNSMVVINYLDQLQSGTFEHAIHHLIDERLDLSVFYPKYQNDATGRPAYDPGALLKIILFAYSKGITSSREIQWCCETNVIFKALSCDTVPHFTTIASFVSGRRKEIEKVFEHVLLICHTQGLFGNELFAIDGCKMSSNAAKEWSDTFKELKEKRAKLKRQVSFRLDSNRPPNYTDWMKHRVDSPKGKQNYSHRMSVVEPVFGNIGTNKKLNRFSLIGKDKVQTQWYLYCLIHNIEKLKNYGQLTA